MGHTLRLVDSTLDELLAGLPAIALDGAKGVGKTATAARRADTVLSADLPATRLRFCPTILGEGQAGDVGHRVRVVRNCRYQRPESLSVRA